MTQREESDKTPPRYLQRYTRTAAMLALIYFVVSSVYVIVSDRWVSEYSNATELQLKLQTYKGLLFVTLTSALIFGLARRLLGRIARDQRRLQNQQRQLVESERRATTGLIAHAIAHDMNNVLTVGMANVELLRAHGHLDGVGNAMLKDIAASFERLHEVTRRMSHVERPGAAIAPAQVDLMTLVRREADFIRRQRAASSCDITICGPDRLNVSLRVSLVRDMIQNLLLNAAEAVPLNGRIEARVSDTPHDVVIEVHDNGPGVPAEKRMQIFEALYTTKPNGMGLGLMSVKAAVKAHSGRIEVLDSPLGGACFRVTLPKNSV